MSHCEGSDEAGNLGSHVRLPPFPFSAGTSDTKHTHMLFTQLQPRAPRPGERLRFHRTSLRSLPHPWKAMAMPALPPLQVLLMHRSPPAPRPPPPYCERRGTVRVSARLSEVLPAVPRGAGIPHLDHRADPPKWESVPLPTPSSLGGRLTCLQRCFAGGWEGSDTHQLLCFLRNTTRPPFSLLDNKHWETGNKHSLKSHPGAGNHERLLFVPDHCSVT